MDPELRSFLEAMEQRTNAKMETMRTEMETMRTEMAAIEQRAVARDAEARREAGAMRDAIIAEIRALPEGLSTDQREETKRIVADRERALMDEHILPLRASAANHESRLKAVEGR